MGLLIKMQSFKEWKDGLLTTEEMLAGKTYFAECKTQTDMIFDRSMDRMVNNLFDGLEDVATTPKKDWSKEPHHKHCCCDKCAPTEEERDRRAHDFYKHEDVCLCYDCMNTRMKEEYEKNHRPADHEPENLAPSDCE